MNTSAHTLAGRVACRLVGLLLGAAALVGSWSAHAAVVVYQNDFNTPAGWVDQSGNGTGISFQSVNSMYGSAFQQTFTVETIRLAGNANYSDPSGTGGAYTLGMLSAAQNDLLSLTFDVGSLNFVNIAMDFAGMGPVACPLCGGPFGFAGQTPIFDLRLYDTPSGTFNLGSPGTLISSAEMVGSVIASTTTLSWDSRMASLSTVGNSNGKVTLVLDLRAGAGMAGYAAFDNLMIESSDIAGPVPEPATYALMLLGMAMVGAAARRRRG